MIKQVVLNVEGITISGQLYLPEGKAPYPAVCVCHGIPVGTPEDKENGYPRLAERICREGFAVLIFNFRGTGASGGNLDILGWTRDLKAAIDYLWSLSEIDKSHLSLLGFSGGAAVSVYVAAQDSRISYLASCACPAEFTFVTEVDEPQAVVDHFRHIGTIRDKNFPRSAEKWLNGFRRVRPIKYVAGITPRPLLLVHGNQDETVDVSHAYRLYDRAKEPKQMIIIEGAGHQLRQDDRAIGIVIDWLKSQC
ncbi:MAG: alpha/beta hydrolase [Dehalococcoidales bacterium]